MGERLGVSSMTASRLLRTFEEAGLIEVVNLERKRRAREAKVYRWLLSLAAKTKPKEAA